MFCVEFDGSITQIACAQLWLVAQLNTNWASDICGQLEKKTHSTSGIEADKAQHKQRIKSRPHLQEVVL